MKQFDIDSIEKRFFKRGNPLKKLLKISLDLFEAKQTGILYGTNQTKINFLPTSMWDRGIMDRFDGKGLRGAVLKMVGPQIMTAKKLSPIMFHKKDEQGQVQENDGIISYVLRNCADYYKKGISVLICPDTDKAVAQSNEDFLYIPFFSYDGRKIEKTKELIKADTRIMRQFTSANQIYIYLPDYGILVINTADLSLLETSGSEFVQENELKKRLDILIKLVETSSLAYLGQLKGRKGAQLLWRKEKHLRKTSQELIENEKNYRDLYENAPIAYISITPEGKIIRCNQKAEELSGYNHTELLAKNATTLLFDPRENKKGDVHSKLLWDRVLGGKPIKDMELQMLPKNSDSKWISLSIDTIVDKLGNITELRAIAMDISKRKGLEKQLFQAQKMEAIGTLAGGIAHDFNNILSPVSGYAEMLLMDMKKDDPSKQQLDIILDCVKHAKKLVNQILTFSRQKEHTLKVINLSDAIRESLILVKSFLPATIKVNVEIDKKCGLILADPVQIHQVIMNLITNAYHAMEATGGVLEIILKEKKNYKTKISTGEPGMMDCACLMIKDTGTGIAPDILDRVFDPYFSTKEEGLGSGIGLSVVHGIVESHDGQISVESEKEKGTTFDISFPICQEYSAIEKMDTEGMPIQKGNENIMLVDDDKKVAVMETHMLEKLGYKVTCFTSSLNAINVFKGNPDLFDVVITDLTMPDLTGVQFADKLVDIKPTLPVILCTGYGESRNKHHNDSGSIIRTLRKPVAIKELSHTIRQVLDGV